jgi:predicted O-methyltransferase YrrM
MSKKGIRKIVAPLFPVLDVLLLPFTLFSSILLFAIRKIRVSNMPISKKIFKTVGVFPISDHYYEPLFDDRKLKLPLDKDRLLPGIKWNNEAQLALLEKFNYQDELTKIPWNKAGELSFFFNNPSLGPGDAEYLYCMIRHFKPTRIIEIGSGYSTLMAKEAIENNIRENSLYHCDQVCIEPYEMPWLEKTGVQVIRQLVENVDVFFFLSLQNNDILFIDSSHMIRPQGDVLHEFLEILPSLNPGVIIHVHDIFSPKDYTKKHIVDDVLFWNEQYLLEAFLSCNNEFVIIGALNFLKTHFPDKLNAKLPVLRNHPDHLPGSFWMKKGLPDII